MNEVLKAIQDRRSTRGFNDVQLTDGQLKALIDRSVSRWSDFGRFKGTEFWHIITAADADRKMMSATLEGLRGFMRDCMDESIERGVLYGTGAYEKGEVRALPVFKEAYEAGKSC